MAAREDGSRKRAAPLSAALSPDEEAEIAEAVRAELEDEHSARMERLARRKEQQSAERATRGEANRLAAIATLREDTKKKFYEEKGYQRVTDHGRERWLPAEEASAHLRAKGRHGRKTLQQSLPQRLKMVPLYVVLALIAIAIGLVIAR